MGRYSVWWCISSSQERWSYNGPYVVRFGVRQFQIAKAEGRPPPASVPWAGAFCIKPMTFSSGIILGAVQGITEFLPISSSGHLILAREFFGLYADHGLAVDAVLQLATSLAVLAYFRRDIAGMIRTFFAYVSGKAVGERDRIMFLAVMLGTVPVVAAGLMLEGFMETVFRNPLLVAGALAAGSILLFAAEKLASQDNDLSLRRGIAIGFFQVLALVPGFSRSGATISGGLIFGMKREDAARFSFLLSFPAILGSGMKKLIELYGGQALGEFGLPLAASFAVSFAVGLLSIHFFLRFLRRHTLHVFAAYRLLLAAVIVALAVM